MGPAQLTQMIIGAAIAVHRALGPGLLESVYEACLFEELMAMGLNVRRQVEVPIHYRGKQLKDTLRIDLLVEGYVVLEIKAVDQLHPIHKAQLLTYLKVTNRSLGLLINFNVPKLTDGVQRVVNREPEA